MNIQIRIAAQQALRQLQQMQQQIAATRTQVAALQKQQAGGAAAAAAGGGLGNARSTQQLGKWGNQLQWTGRQIQYNFTLPILAAAAAATKFQLDNEKAFTQVSKVYGDTQAAAAQFMKEQKGLTQEMATQKATQVFKDELTALGDAFEALSNHYGVQQKQVLEVAGAWAAAGASGVDLAKSVQISLQTAILGSMDAVKATEALIAIQGQYSMSTDQLTETIATLNAVENQTGISMQGLIDGFSRSAGVAREAGVDVRHLAAFLAAMTPAAGSAAQAGNALKTIISRLMSPTREAAQVMNEMGLNIKSMDWQGANATERLLIMSKAFQGLSDSQKQVASSVIASRWQINKFDVLMRELVSTTGFYQKALDATLNRGKVFTQMQKELNTVLSSNPQRLNQIWVMLQNASADVIQPMIPYIIYLSGVIKDLIVGFSNLNPELQKFIVVGLLMIAVVGPLIRYIGSTASLIYELGKGFMWLMGPFKGVAGLFKMFGTGLLAVVSSINVFHSGLMAGVKVMGLWVKAIFSAMLPLQVIFGVLFTQLFRVAVSGWGMIGKAATLPLRMMLGQALLNLGALVGLFQSSMRRIVMAVVGSGLGNAVGGMIQWVMRLGTVTGPLTGIWGAAALAWQRIWLAMYTAFMLTFGALPRVAAAASAGVQAVWTILGARLVVIQAGFQARLVALWVAMSGGMASLFSRLATVLTALWMGLASRLVAISSVMWLAMMAAPGRFLAFMAGVPARIGAVAMAMGRSLVAAIPAILAALRVVGPMVFKFLLGPWGLAIGAIIGVVYHFRDAISTIWNNIIKYFSDSSNGLVRGVIGAWNLLPQGVQNALVAVVKVVRAAALQVYEWFSYLNPFAHHSPSLVENVTAGMTAVEAQFKNAGQVGGHLRGAYADIKAFGNAVRGITGTVGSLEQADHRAQIAKWAPAALAAFDALERRLIGLRADLDQLKAAVDAQQRVVNQWEAALNRANAALDAQQNKLDKLKDVAQGYSDQLDASKQRLSDFASAPLAGMGAMEDAIFANDQAQKKLRLEMMKLEDATGPLENVKSKIDALNGAQELLTGKKNELRSAGAGSEILKVYDSEISKLKEQSKQYQQSGNKLQTMQDQLDKLGRTAEKLDLEKSLKFDPLTRAIEKAANAMKELPFDQIMAGIRGAQADVTKYQKALDGANAAVAKQEQAVKAAAAARDLISKRYDEEKNKLDAIKAKYDEVEQAIRAVESALNDAASAADSLSQKKPPKPPKEYISPGLQNFRDAAGGNFPDVGGAGVAMRKDWSSQVPDIKKFTDDLSKQTANMFKDLNPFAPIKQKFNEFKGWLGKVWSSLWGGVRDFASHIFDGVDIGGATSSIGDKIQAFGDWLKGVWSGIVGVLTSIWRLLGPDIIKIFQELWKGVVDVWNQVAPEIEKFGDLFGPIGQAIQNVWTVAKPVLTILGGAVLFLVKLALSIIANVIGPVFHAIGGIIKGIIQVIRGAVQIIVGIFTLDLGMILDGVKNIFGGLINIIWSILKGGVQIIWGVIKGLVEGIWNFFKWLWNELVGHSIIPDMVNAIIAVFKWLGAIPKWIWDNVLAPIYNFFKSIWEKYLAPFISNMIKGAILSFQGLKIVAKWIWDNVLLPVYNFFKAIWTNYLSPFTTSMIRGWILIFQGIKAIVQWIWNNVLLPIANFIKNIWTGHIKPAVDTIANGVIKGFQKIGTLIKWVNDKFITPLKTAFGLFTDAVGKIFDKIKEKISGPIDKIKGWINDNLIDPLNKVVKLFGITIPKFSVGGPTGDQGIAGGGHNKLAGGGRVGGFSPSHTADNIPAWLTANEFVHPVKAVKYYGTGIMEAMRKRQIPKEAFSTDGYFLGGLIDKGMNKVQGWMEKGPEFAINNIMNPAKNLISRFMPVPEFANKQAIGMVNYAQKTLLDFVHKAFSADGPSGPPGAVSIFRGKRLNQRTIQMVLAAERLLGGKQFAITQGSYSTSVAASGSTHAGGGAMDTNEAGAGWARAQSVLRQVGFAAWHRTPSQGPWNDHIHSIALGDPTASPAAKNQMISYKNGGDGLGGAVNKAIGKGMYSGGLVGMARLFGAEDGALVRGSRGGTPVMVGEGSRDELIQPLPADWRNGRPDSNAGTTININGNLEFPNITSGEDVEELVEGLKVLAGDYK